jgi:hypothetical protein
MGLQVAYFYSLTPREFYNIAVGYRKKQDEAIKTSWEQTRKIAWATLMCYHKTGTLKPEEVFSFPWDTSITDLTEAEKIHRDKAYEEMLARWAERDRKRNEKTDC